MVKMNRENQLSRVLKVVRDRKWHTLEGIEWETGDPTPSISARLRDLRKEGFVVEAKRMPNNLYKYKVYRRRGLLKG